MILVKHSYKKMFRLAITQQHKIINIRKSLGVKLQPPLPLSLFVKGLFKLTLAGYRSINEGSQGRNSNRSLKQKTWKKGHFSSLFALNMLTQLPYITQDSLARE